MKNKRKQDIEIGIAAFLIVAWQATICYSALANKPIIGYLATVIFGLSVYIAWRSDREEKARLRYREARSEMMQRSLDELEQWREQREAD